MTTNLSLQSMKIFVEVFERRSVGSAARALGLSQSGLSTALARLRLQLDDPLFIGNANGMRPTARAKSLIEPVREAVQCIEERILRPVGFDPATDQREFVIAMTDGSEAIYMPRLLQAVMRAAPGVRLRAVDLPQLELTQTLAEGQIDLALGYFPDLSDHPALRHRLLGQHGFVCVVGSSNRRRSQGLDLRAYCEDRHVILDSPMRSLSLLDRTLQRRGIVRRVALTTLHVMAIAEIIAVTDCIATVPAPIGDYFAEVKRVICLPTPFRSPVFDGQMIWSQGNDVDPANTWLRQLVVQCFVADGRGARH